MNPLKSLPFLTFATFVFFSSCTQKSYLQSPMQGNTFAYRNVPLASDSIKTAVYVNGAFSIGGMNYNYSDGVYSFQSALHMSHVLGNFRLNYGASLLAGSYNINSSSYFNYYNGNYINHKIGNLFFGGYGLNGGISAAMQFGRRSEWRYIGVEGSLFNEFGDYYKLRKNIGDSLVTEIDRKKYLGSLGLNTEIVFKGRSKNEFGIKLAAGSFLRRLDYANQSQSGYYHPYDDLIYFSNTYHVTFRKNTIYWQFNFATHAIHFQLGYNFRL